MEDIRKVVAFDSVEEFWGLYNNIVPPSQLPGKANYYLFKVSWRHLRFTRSDMQDGIMPAWEDPANKHGGKWAIQVPRDKTKSVIDKMWLYTVSRSTYVAVVNAKVQMLAAIGETFETPLPKDGQDAPVPAKSDLVTGVIVSARPGL